MSDVAASVDASAVGLRRRRNLLHAALGFAHIEPRLPELRLLLPKRD
jgi:hypothetical protein